MEAEQINNFTPFDLSNVLTQALQSSDKQLIDFTLEKTPQQNIKHSISKLELSTQQKLIDYICDKCESYPYQLVRCVPWIKEIIFKGHGDFVRLRNLLDERTKNFQKLQSLNRQIQAQTQRRNQQAIKKQPQNKLIFVEADDTINVITEDTEVQTQNNQPISKFKSETDKEFEDAMKMHENEIFDQNKKDQMEEDGTFLKF